LIRRENFGAEGLVSLDLLFKANRRLYKADLLKEQFGQLLDFDDPKHAALYFSEWRSGLRWQKLAPFEKFARMIGTHWDGIASYCATENKVPLWFVEGLYNLIRVLQRRAYGFRDEDCLRLKFPSYQLPKL
jgi:transposase